MDPLSRPDELVVNYFRNPAFQQFQQTVRRLNNVSQLIYSQQKGKRPLMNLGTALERVGYARVSTTEQNADLQRTALKAAGCHRIFTDHGVSGSRASRPELDKMLEHLRDGD